MILGVKVDEMDLEGARERAREFLRDLIGKQHKIFTPNPEMAVKAQKDENFKNILNAGDLNLCDGFGLALACRLAGTKAPRITGANFMLELCQVAAEEGRSVYLLGSGEDEVVRKAAENLKQQFPNLKIAGCDKGPAISENFQSVDNSTIQLINQSRPDILFVAFGMGKQEKWIHENLSKMPSVKIAMGVGGAFDYLSGKVKRAPLLMRKVGLEWMYRLLTQPRRFERIFNATIRFTYLLISSRG